jgi:hypothetical protein
MVDMRLGLILTRGGWVRGEGTRRREREMRWPANAEEELRWRLEGNVA